MAQFILQALYSSIIVTLVMANSLGDLQKSYADLVIECAKEFPITPEDIAQLQNKQLPEREPVKCLFACAYKKAGMMDERLFEGISRTTKLIEIWHRYRTKYRKTHEMDDEGKMSVDGAKEVITKYLSDDPITMKKAIDFTNACSIVNDADVSDGTKGCDRAALMFRCSIDKADEFDINF